MFNDLSFTISPPILQVYYNFCSLSSVLIKIFRFYVIRCWISFSFSASIASESSTIGHLHLSTLNRRFNNFFIKLFTFRLRFIDIKKHIFKVIIVLFNAIKILSSYDFPILNNVNSVIPIVTIKAATAINSYAEFTAEKVSDNLA